MVKCNRNDESHKDLPGETLLSLSLHQLNVAMSMTNWYFTSLFRMRSKENGASGNVFDLAA